VVARNRPLATARNGSGGAAGGRYRRSAGRRFVAAPCGLLRTAFQPANARATVEYRPLPPDSLPEDPPGPLARNVPSIPDRGEGLQPCVPMSANAWTMQQRHHTVS
jgi:hypothetical protein